MTEQLWFAGRNPSRLLDIVCTTVHRVPDRRLRLYLHACCANLPEARRSEQLNEAIRVGERYVDGLMSLDELNEFRSSRVPRGHGDRPDVLANAVLSGNKRLWDSAKQTHNIVSDVIRRNPAGDEERLATVINVPFPTVRDQFCYLIREIFGNPFRPVEFDSEWRSDTALSIAKHIYENRDFAQMPILADALQDAGCDNADILNHCRDANQVHVRGCWVVDLVLGKA